MGTTSVGDVASAAGVKLSDAENAMKAIAADTGATLEVSAQGDILYVFDRDFRSLLNAKSTKIKTVEPLVEGAGKVGGYLLRISFGTTLLASIVIVYTAIAALLSNRDERDRDEASQRNRAEAGQRHGNASRQRHGNATSQRHGDASRERDECTPRERHGCTGGQRDRREAQESR